MMMMINDLENVQNFHTVPKQELVERKVLEHLTYKLYFTNNFPMKPDRIQY